MGIWKEIKKTLNGTVGTQDFKPLDQIIKGQRTLAASDSVIRVLNATEQQLSSGYKDFGTFAPKIGNSVRISFDIRANSTGTGSGSVTMEVVETNGSSSVVATKSKSVSIPTQSVLYIDVPVEANTYYTLRIKASSSSFYVSNVNVCANIIDSNLVKVN